MNESPGLVPRLKRIETLQPAHGVPPDLLRPFRIIAFDWDGTAVEDRRSEPRALRDVLERLLDLDVLVVIITGTHFENVDRQLTSSILGSHKQNLYVATNRGSEVFGFDALSRPVLLRRRNATPDENKLLTKAADAVLGDLLQRTKLPVRIISGRLNRRKIDLLPLPEWSDPPKSRIAELLGAVQNRLTSAGISGGLREVMDESRRFARAEGLPEARITTDAKHVEIGLTDKGDSARWILDELASPRGIGTEEILVAGDEFGTLGGCPGSDSRLMIPELARSRFVSVGREPEGVPPEIVFLGGGPARFLDLLLLQAGGHERHRPLALAASPSRDSSWVLVEEGLNLVREHEVESLFAVSNGYLGTRGALEEGSAISAPGTFLAGVYDSGGPAGPIPELALAPDWAACRIGIEGTDLGTDGITVVEHRRILDTAQGILWREGRFRDKEGRLTQFRSMRLASLADRHSALHSLSLLAENYAGVLRFRRVLEIPGTIMAPRALLPVASARSEKETPPVREFETAFPKIRVAFALADSALEENEELPLGVPLRSDRLLSVATSRDADDPARQAKRHLNDLSTVGLREAIRNHRGAWTRRWRLADVEIEGDPEVQRALRFALYHLISAANPEDGRASVGARALTGPIYSGHVFWDTEIYMLPFYTLTHPESARALLAYRHRTLGAAREKARRMGYAGALFAWESAATGEETTPTLIVAPDGQVLPVRSADEELHISADVAYATWRHYQATGDLEFLWEMGAELLLETARFWASRIEVDSRGVGHLRGIMGPDEYHEGVDDNAYTNTLAAWNLRVATQASDTLKIRSEERWRDLLSRIGLSDLETRRWPEMARNLYTGLDPSSGLIEQFRGYFRLEDLRREAVGPLGGPADLLLGRERVQASQLLKQADVVLLLHLLGQEFPREIRERNFRYYEPRTAHGSSLSPGIHAAVAARLGDLDLALRYLRQTAAIDLANNMGNSAGGVHAAALGSLWQSVVFGFAGFSFDSEGLRLDPHLPPTWSALRFHVQWRGRRFRIECTARDVGVLLEEGEPSFVRIREAGPERLDPGTERRFQLGAEMSFRAAS